MKILAVAAIMAVAVFTAEAAKVPTPTGLPNSYPRIHVTNAGKAGLEKTIETEKWAQDVKAGIHRRIDKYVDQHVKDPEWMPSRLMMHWKTKHSNIYIKGITYSHADGEAPVPTVRFAGSRDYTTDYAAPSIEEMMPYMDDERGLYLRNKTREGRPFEWVSQSKTGGIVNSWNERIINLARDAAFIYWLEGEEKYAKFAYDIFDVYMQGMYYRNEPIDLDNGHIQTLVGLTCFQVIHEKGIKGVSEIYDFLNSYIAKNHKANMANYEVTIKKWIDLIIQNGVPQNNWNLHQANLIIKAAMVLQDDADYADKKGRQYYIDYMLNVTSPRQWSMTKLMDFGYDKSNGIWAECPGYAQSVTHSMMAFIVDFENAFGMDLMPYYPFMEEAVRVLPQYIFPNGESVAFGDSNYVPISGVSMRDVIRLAQKSGNKEAEREFTAMYRLFEPNADVVDDGKPRAAEVASFFASKPLVLNKDYKAGVVSDYITQTFHAPSVSWHVQRMGEGKDGLMVSLNGSLGNHMHANGINMELYGKGLVQGADPGKGANYLQAAYLEYYSQFPAHNTVMVDGASTYTEMMSYHGFEVEGEYPKSGQREGFHPDVTYTKVSFIEPETMSDQNRTVSIVRTGETTGYYVDIFRSKRRNGKDMFHDYYYHNLGQTMEIRDNAGNPMKLKEEEKVGFAGGHLYALDYMWGEKHAATSEDYQVEWKIDFAGESEDVFMNLWMRGAEGREVISINSPACKAWKSDKNFPYAVSKEPYLTFIARQNGNAWDAPFVSIYEPFTSTEGKSIKAMNGFEDQNGSNSFAGVEVEHKSGRKDYIMSSDAMQVAKYKDMTSNAAYTMFGIESKGKYEIFVGNGTSVQYGKTRIKTEECGNVALVVDGNEATLYNEVAATVTLGGKSKKYKAGTHSIKF